MAEPPQYTSSSSSHQLFEDPPEEGGVSTVLFNITPLPNSVSFQTGFLGHTDSALKGELQIKIIEGGGDSKANASKAGKGKFSKVEIQFRGIERGNGEEVELTEQSKILWENSLQVAQAARAAVGPSTLTQEEVEPDDGPPSTLPFEFELTSDLPHCVHLTHDPSSSNLEYFLIARLHFADPSIPPLERDVPIHLTRYTPPGPLPSAFSSTSTADYNPQTVTAQEPIPVIVKLSKTRLRKSDNLQVVAKIPPPVGDVVIIKELRLRNITAEIVRVVRTLNAPFDSDDEDGSEPDFAAQELETVLWRSGKSCRLSPTRPIVIKLQLHLLSSLESSGSPCETISQGTILHEVEFYVRVTVAMTSGLGDRSERRDVVVEKRLEILPDVPPPGISSEKQRLMDEESLPDPPAWEDLQTPLRTDNPNTVPAYRESWLEDSNAYAGTSRSRAGGWMEIDSSVDGEEEFDGYEELSTGADLCLPPPTIDEDESPPPAPGMTTAYNTSGSSSSNDGHQQAEPSNAYPPQHVHHPHRSSFGSGDSSRESFMLIPINASSLSLALQGGNPMDVPSLEHEHHLQTHSSAVNSPPQVYAESELEGFVEMDLNEHHRFLHHHRHSPYPREMSPPRNNQVTQHFISPEGMNSSYSSSGSERHRGEEESESEVDMDDRDVRPPPYAGSPMTPHHHHHPEVEVNVSGPPPPQAGPPPSYHDSNTESMPTEVLGMIARDGRVGVVML
ncbi:hypothetical protein BT69DRAFT_1347843 [Atractiella rhizophila]|nr:hypothetical protein BT69DRAFT_1347843 [Atractiella rhizophila]